MLGKVTALTNQLEQTCKASATYMNKELEHTELVTQTKHLARIKSFQKKLYAYMYIWPLKKQLIAFWSKWYYFIILI